MDGFNRDLNFLGTYNEDYCETFIKIQDDDYHPQNVIKMRERWENLKEQLEGFGIQIILTEDTPEMITTHTDDGSVKSEEAKPQPKRIENRKVV